jgi:adenylylsulfate kinase|tara:strand:- start:28 stop:483 length:456 start_codon:yes stop_codon:yes gene_type:complete
MNQIKKILIIGLPGSGKTTLAKRLVKTLKAKWLNADHIRKKYNDWDFSKEGILRQSKRMAELSKKFKIRKYIIADFICPYEKGRKIFRPDFLIWMDTIKKGRFRKNSIDKLFQAPKKFNFRIKEKNANVWSLIISEKIKQINIIRKNEKKN